MRQMGYDAKLHISCTIGPVYRAIPLEMRPHKLKLEYGVDYDDQAVELIRQIRPRLQPAYRSLPDEDLLSGSIFLSARKRASG